MGRPLASQTLSPPRPKHPRVSILLPKTSQIILDKVLVLDKGTASVNAPPPLHRKITTSYRLSVTHTAMKKKLSGANYPLLAAVLLLPLALSTASGQTLAPTRKLPLNEALETSKNMPPAPPRKIETSPPMVSQFGVFTSFQANVDANGNNILDDAANEPAISVDPTDGNKMVIGWRQFDDITSDFRQGGWGYTTDAGVTWTFPGVLEPGVFRSDPVMHADETGKFFYLSLLGDNFCDDIWRSTNGGQIFTEQSPNGAGHGGDKQWFTIDKTGGPGHGFQYQFWSGFFPCDTGEFNRSTDSGITWSTPINLPNDTDTGALDVDNNGNLFVGGSDFNGEFRCLRSSDAQNGNPTITFDQNTLVDLDGFLIQGGINGIGLCGQTFIAVDRSGTATNNNIYMLASTTPDFSSGTNVMFARSTDGGLTFSPPHRVNDDPVNANKWHFFGTLSVAPNGRIDVVWYDTRNAPNNIDSQLFYSFSTDGGATWAPNVQVSNTFNPQAGFPNNQKIGDYITIVSDNTGGNVAYAATFNENPNAVGGHEQDVYYVRVSPTGGPTPTPTGDSFCDTKCNANFYSHANNYAQCYTNAHDYSYATTNTHASNKADAESSSYSATEAHSVTL